MKYNAIMVTKDKMVHKIVVLGRTESKALLNTGSRLAKKYDIAGIAIRKGWLWVGINGNGDLFSSLIPSVKADNDISFGSEVEA